MINDKEVDDDVNPSIPSSSSSSTIKISRPSNFVNLTPVFNSDMTSNVGNTHINGVPSIFPFFNDNARRTTSKSGITKSFVQPSRILNVCAHHLPIIMSIWLLFNWKNSMKFNALNSLFILNPEESSRTYVDDISDHLLKSFLSHPHLIHNSVVDFEICSWIVDKWISLIDSIISKNSKKN